VASFTLGVTTIVRRMSEAFGAGTTALVPITMVGTALIGQYLITLLSPVLERWLFHGGDRQELRLVRYLEEHLLTRNDLRQFMEMILTAACDRLQASGAYVAALEGDHLQLVFNTGTTNLEHQVFPDHLQRMAETKGHQVGIFQWGEDYVAPLFYEGVDKEPDLLGLLVVSGAANEELDQDEVGALGVLAKRAALALHDRQTQRQILHSFELLTPEIETIQRMRAAGRYDGDTLLKEELPAIQVDVFQWVKEALSHYWGGPKLVQSPLMELKVVQKSIDSSEGNHANALRSILRQAVERVRPPGDRRFTAEWILYNILEMKFMEGKKVREVAMRLAMSEADLYRKQRVAIEAVAREILDMEAQAHDKAGSAVGIDRGGNISK
ncbi:MAG: hypothetical protein U1B80_07165, partial [Anaerolineaceae bacterium]|nr:hypothetical protein [Anaerolineaceae bacterium]